MSRGHDCDCDLKSKVFNCCLLIYKSVIHTKQTWLKLTKCAYCCLVLFFSSWICPVNRIGLNKSRKKYIFIKFYSYNLLPVIQKEKEELTSKLADLELALSTSEKTWREQERQLQKVCLFN